MPSHNVTLITGGSRSGKTAYALQQAEPYTSRVYLATAIAFDHEMQQRIQRHQCERENRFHTIEEPEDLAGALQNLPKGTDVVLIDCLTVWLGNLLHRHGIQKEPFPATTHLLDLLKNPPCDLILVTNETGSGIIPMDPISRNFSDHAGWLNQDVARIANRVVWVACGLPQHLKGTP